ncbi:MAG: ribose-phosphate diphosphokinase [Patescibacteria group bacterium]
MVKAINLDKNFNPTDFDIIDYEMLQFSGGEMHIKVGHIEYLDETEKVIITNRFRNGDDLMKVLIAKDALERLGVKKFDLVMPYVPYARQDRQCAEREAFSLKVFVDIINSAKFNKVYVLDAHSDVAPALINHCINLSNEEYVIQAVKSTYCNESDIILVSPDSGANKKTNKLFDNTKIFKKIIKCDKRRDVKTGELSGFEVFTSDLSRRPCIIVDDICDGGRTFVGIAEALAEKNAGCIYLFVTHGIFSQGTKPLKRYFKKIFCTDSFKDITINDDPNYLIHQIKIKTPKNYD